MFRTLRFYHSFFKFLSTPSSRRATGAARHHATVPTYFYPRPPRGGRPLCDHCRLPPALISIHALREEGDNGTTDYIQQPDEFLSTPSARRATYFFFVPCRLLWISIHALREEGDYRKRKLTQPYNDFYPRPPRGGRLENPVIFVNLNSLFLSTPSARRATRRSAIQSLVNLISIHALREEGDVIITSGYRTPE